MLNQIEAIIVTIEKKKKCNDKALQIVTDFSEGTISEHVLLDNLKFINQEHYQDIVEERAINKLCGYPICPKPLENIPSKQYHISTTLNKVFDITDRKNFCSNLCYKASKFLKDQVLTSPLWLREDESTTCTLISLQSGGGMSGDEIDLGVNPVKIDLEIPSTDTDPNEDCSPEDVANELKSKTSNNNPKASGNVNADVNERRAKCSNSEVSLSEKCNPENTCEQSKEEGINEERCCVSHKCGSEEVVCETKNIVQLSYSDKTSPCDSSQTCGVSSSQEGFVSNSSDSSRKDDKIINPPILGHQAETKTGVTKSHKHSSKRKCLVAKNKSNTPNLNPLHNVVLRIEQILREWVSVDSLCFIFGVEKIKELLAEKKNRNLPAFTQDVHLYERYLAICKKLNVLELEDTKIDASFRDEVKKPLPDYEALKEETKEMEIKVKMFFKGDKVKFDDKELNKESESRSGANDIEPVLPLVDIHAQKALRRRIVIDKLRKVFEDLQKSLGLRGFNLTEDLRTLVSTFMLSAHNITMKPAEWTLVSIAIIKLLSLRDSLLAQALTSSTADRHLTLLMMSYSLDAGYLDRLMLWLTDVEAVLQKT